MAADPADGLEEGSDEEQEEELDGEEFDGIEVGGPTQVVGQDEASRSAWRTNALILYDLFVSFQLVWPALSVSWLPDEPGEGARLAIGFHTDGSEPHEVIVAELSCSVDDYLAADPWRTWTTELFGDAEGFGCTATDGGGPLRAVARLAHPTEVNKIAPCPGRPQLLATKAATGDVYLYDYKVERLIGEVSPQARLMVNGGQPVDGFALAWNPCSGGRLLASGGNAGRLQVWDVEALATAVCASTASTAPAAAVSTLAPRGEAEAHQGALCDLSFSRQDPCVLASVGDEGLLRLWDVRAGAGGAGGLVPQASVRVSAEEALGVDWNFYQERVLATAGKDSNVKVWDLRKLGGGSDPLHCLRGHRGDAVAVQWAPFRDGLLASCSADSRMHIWDLNPKNTAEEFDDEDGDEGDDCSPELLFSHSGHRLGVSDFSWSVTDNYLMCSVAEDSTLHIWQPSTDFYLDDESDKENEGVRNPDETTGDMPVEPEAKRPRQAP